MRELLECGGLPAHRVIVSGRPDRRGVAVDQSAKALGAFYTDAGIADFLVWWAIRSPNDTVMDPSFGGGVFLCSACKRLRGLGGQPARQVFGAEIDPSAYARSASELLHRFGVRKQNLFLADFFRLDATTLRQVDAIIGNPPFVRYQRFCGDARQTALARAAREGVRLTELSSSWAPFLIHSIAMVKDGGRLAMVAPMEITHAAYALPVLRHLCKSFRRITFLTFRKKLFPELSQETLLVLAEDKGSPCSSFVLRDLGDSAMLDEIRSRDMLPLPRTRRVSPRGLCEGRERLIAYLIPAKARELYSRLRDLTLARRLGELADVGIGYVTGANDFFHLGPEEVHFWKIPEAFLKPAVLRGRALSGLRFTKRDWREAVATGEARYLLHIQTRGNLPDSVRQYLQYGESAGVSKAYKCRTRSPWFRVPHVSEADGFLSYMSGLVPRLVANDAGAVAPNSLHIFHLYRHASLTVHGLAALWQTSLTRLSTELEGHALGGGMLKLEPTEAENVLVAVPEATDGTLAYLVEELDGLLRVGDDATAQARADKAILKEGIGLNESECRLLRMAGEMLRSRRYSRGLRP
jgi:adenine-specific DNA methylase